VSRAALIVIDMINTYDHPDAAQLRASVEATLPVMVEQIERAREDDMLTIYVNDNFGRWRSSFSEIVEQAKQGPHWNLVEPVAPPDDALFVVKARHSIFYQTPLEYLLAQEDVTRLTLIGQVTEQCILYSALDAYIRHLEVRVPCDAVAHIHQDLADAALRMMERNMEADVSPARDRGCRRR
jgi:nicotinamidase-related amidase